jgi:glycosyltransferase involved in cell wall biosynthesis
VRVAILSPAWFPVPPKGYGGIEAVVALLADGLVDAGHDVTLFASGDSGTKAKVVSYFEEAPSSRIGTAIADLLHALTCLERAGAYDVVNDHSGPLAAAIGCLVRTPVVHTAHGPVTGEAGTLYRKLAAVSDKLALVSLSLSQRRPAPTLPWLANIPNALPVDAYPEGEAKGDFLLFLGRMSPEKGARRAIEVARTAGLPLKLAGKCREPAELRYFSEQVEPFLGPDAEYLGEVTHEEKVELLQQARLLLFPIEWEEPFGLVMIEAMACGTPVVATRHGAVPEVIREGLGGVIVDHYSQMPDVLEDAFRLDPAAFRQDVEERFAPRRMVEEYLGAFEQAIDRRAERKARRRAERMTRTERSEVTPAVPAGLPAEPRSA